MKTLLLIRLVPAVLIAGMYALPLNAQSLLSRATESRRLQMEGDGGRNGASVAWNPVRQLYYAAIAGNTAFPLETFSATGRNLSAAEAGFDFRGLWWDPKARALMGNGYSESGWWMASLTSSGHASGDGEVAIAGMNQPEEQSVGAYDPASKRIAFLGESQVVLYSPKTGAQGKAIALNGVPCSWDEVNYTSAICTGSKTYTYGILEYEARRVHFFSRKGAFTGSIRLPDDAPANFAFCFAYANGLMWLFDIDARVWIGYEIFR
ncbi:MAG: hypothetical protein NW241_17140 [Bacteroidia bacterium]|nr:hypothetical protein [Bacteroidia bacterium]